MPPAAAWEAIAQIQSAAQAAFAENRIRVGEIRAHATPRRIVLIAERLAPRQDDLVREVRGPAARAAYAPDGHPTPAAEGFARAQGIPVSALDRRVTPQGEYVFAVRRSRGEPTVRALSALLPRIASALTFPKTMRWGPEAIRFVRPIRWILVLDGTRIIPFSFAGVRAGRRTFGRRGAGPNAVTVADAAAFEAVLKRHGVLLDPAERGDRITREVTRAAERAGGRPILDPDLLRETVQLAEWPEALEGRFAREFLALPREVLITVMQHHQKYFAVEDAQGALLPAFVAVTNGGPRNTQTVREGNEWVLRARLADARFFFDEDRKRPLASRAGELDGLVVHEKLGTVAQKARRLVQLAGLLGDRLGLDREAARHLARAAELSKTDLVTQMVREFPELQGVVGGIYARLEGEPEAVAQALREQYLPKGAALPRSDLGAYLALLDKVDALLGALAVGLVPTGSQDPYGLRRAASGIVAIILDRRMRLNVRAFLADALERVYAAHPAPARAAALEGTLDLLRQRLRSALIDAGLPYDTVDAALAAGADDLADAAARARALWAFRRRPEFSRLYTAFDRAARILPPTFDGEVRRERVEGPAERRLLDALERAAPHVRAAGTAGRYDEALAELATLADPVDRFFVEVLVMAEDEAVRANRLALLAAVVRLVRSVADLSRAVVGEGKPDAGS